MENLSLFGTWQQLISDPDTHPQEKPYIQASSSFGHEAKLMTTGDYKALSSVLTHSSPWKM